MKQVAFLAVFVLCSLVHALAFKDVQVSWADAATRYQGLYVFYFFVAHFVCEYLFRSKGGS